MKRVVIIGAGGFGRELAWIMARVNAASPRFEIVGFCDDAPDKQSGTWAEYPLLGRLTGLAPNFAGIGFVCAIGNNRIRQKVTCEAQALGYEPVSVIDPSAVVAPDVEPGAGSYIGIGSVVSCGCQLGAGVLINHQVCVGHDVTLGAYAQLCPGVCVSGGCEIGTGAFLGSLSGTIPLKRVGAWATVGAGVVALRDVGEGGNLVRLGAREI